MKISWKKAVAAVGLGGGFLLLRAGAATAAENNITASNTEATIQDPSVPEAADPVVQLPAAGNGRAGEGDTVAVAPTGRDGFGTFVEVAGASLIRGGTGAALAVAGATAGSAGLGLAALARTGAGLTAPTLVGLLLLALGWALRRGGRRLVTS